MGMVGCADRPLFPQYCNLPKNPCQCHSTTMATLTVRIKPPTLQARPHLPSMFLHFCRTSYTSRSAKARRKPTLEGCPDGSGQTPTQVMLDPQGSRFPLQSPAPTSCAFINDLLDLRLLRCALSGLLGWWGWCIRSCLRLNPHVCVNFLVWILLLCTKKTGDHTSYRLILATYPQWGTTLPQMLPSRSPVLGFW